MMNPTTRSPRQRKHKQKEELKPQEIIAQVHKPVKSRSNSENDLNNLDDNVETKKTIKKEDNNENCSIHTPSRDISVDGESQINYKILSLIETEMKRDSKQSHFTDSRPQSLSFYEDEKIPEELSGNLELLSPEERKHYRKRKEYLQMDMVIQDLYSKDADDGNTKKTKSKRKRHTDPDVGIGDSTEMMIPKTKRKGKKKKRDGSPPNNINKRKHKKRDEEFEPKNEITAALEDLQDDVFEISTGECKENHDMTKKSPMKADKLYIQKKYKFESSNKPYNNNNTSALQISDNNADDAPRNPVHQCLDIAIQFQHIWMQISTICYGLLGGLSLGHCFYVITNMESFDDENTNTYNYYGDFFTAFYYALCVICIISLFDRLDIGHHENLLEVFKFRKLTIVLVMYFVCVTLHLSMLITDDKTSVLEMSDENSTALNATVTSDFAWNYVSLFRSTLAVTGWVTLGLGKQDHLLHSHLHGLKRFLPGKP